MTASLFTTSVSNNRIGIATTPKGPALESASAPHRLSLESTDGFQLVRRYRACVGGDRSARGRCCACPPQRAVEVATLSEPADAQDAGEPSAIARYAHAAGRRLVRAAKWQQQRGLPGQRDQVARLAPPFVRTGVRRPSSCASCSWSAARCQCCARPPPHRRLRRGRPARAPGVSGGQAIVPVGGAGRQDAALKRSSPIRLSARGRARVVARTSPVVRKQTKPCLHRSASL